MSIPFYLNNFPLFDTILVISRDIDNIIWMKRGNSMNVMTIYAFQNSLNFTLFDMKNEEVIMRSYGIYEKM